MYFSKNVIFESNKAFAAVKLGMLWCLKKLIIRYLVFNKELVSAFKSMFSQNAYSFVFLMFFAQMLSVVSYSSVETRKGKWQCSVSASTFNFTDVETDLKKLQSAYRAHLSSDEFVKRRFYSSLKAFYDHYKNELGYKNINGLLRLISISQRPQSNKTQAAEKPKGYMPELIGRVERMNAKDYPPWRIENDSGERHILRFNKRTGYVIREDQHKLLNTQLVDSNFLFALVREDEGVPYTEKGLNDAIRTLKIYESDNDFISESNFDIQSHIGFKVLKASKQRILVIGDKGGILNLEKKNGQWIENNSESKIDYNESLTIGNSRSLDGNVFLIEYEKQTQYFSASGKTHKHKLTGPSKINLLGYSWQGEFRLQDISSLGYSEKTDIIVGNSKNIFFKGGFKDFALRLESGQWKKYPIEKSRSFLGRSMIGDLVSVNENVFLSLKNGKLFCIEFNGSSYVKKYSMDMPGKFENPYAEKNEFVQILNGKGGVLTTFRIGNSQENYLIEEIVRFAEGDSWHREKLFSYDKLVHYDLPAGRKIDKEKLELIYAVVGLEKSPFRGLHGDYFYFISDNYFYWMHKENYLHDRIKVPIRGENAHKFKSENLPNFIKAVFFITKIADSMEILEIYKDGSFAVYEVGETKATHLDFAAQERQKFNYSEKGYRIMDKFYRFERKPIEGFFDE